MENRTTNTPSTSSVGLLIALVTLYYTLRSAYIGLNYLAIKGVYYFSLITFDALKEITGNLHIVSTPFFASV